jgi:FlaG/FlaF family flagellin (archaellin)
VPVIAEVLLVGVVVVVGLVLITLTLGLVEDVDSPAPVVSETSGVVAPTTDGQTIEITHVAGDTVRLSNVEIVVDATAACGRQARIVDLPLDGERYLHPDNVTGAAILSTANRSAADYDPGALLAERFAAGETIGLRLADSCSLSPGDEVTVTVVHRPRASIVSRTTVVVPGS